MQRKTIFTLRASHIVDAVYKTMLNTLIYIYTMIIHDQHLLSSGALWGLHQAGIWPQHASSTGLCFQASSANPLGDVALPPKTHLPLLLKPKAAPFCAPSGGVWGGIRPWLNPPTPAPRCGATVVPHVRDAPFLCSFYIIKPDDSPWIQRQTFYNISGL